MSPIYLIEKPDAVAVCMEASPLLAHYARMIPGMEYSQDDNMWSAPAGQRSFVMDFCRFAVKRGLASDIIDIDGKVDVHQLFADHMPTMELPKDIPFKPYDYQTKGMRYALEHKRTFFGDDMGLGKTLQAVGTCWLAKSYPVLVVCPLAMKETWKREFE